MKKKIILFIVIIAILVLLVPIPFKLKDGGSIEFKSLLYTVTKYHKLDMESETGFQDGIGIKILGMEVYNNLDKNKIQQRESKEPDIPDAVMVNGRIYYSTGQESTITGRCGNMDGYITSTVQKGTLPTKNDESNFGTEFGYQKTKTDEIEVLIDGYFIVFKDGGTNKYYYNDYTIIKYRTLDGNSDVYIGFPDMMDPEYVKL